jgi:hypothetical protein
MNFNSSNILITTKNETLSNNSIINLDMSEDILEIDDIDSLENKIKSHILSNPLKNYKTLRHNRQQSLFNSKDIIFN